VGLQQLVMRTKALALRGNAEEVCARLPEPPAAAAVRNAVQAGAYTRPLLSST